MEQGRPAERALASARVYAPTVAIIAALAILVAVTNPVPGGAVAGRRVDSAFGGAEVAGAGTSADSASSEVSGAGGPGVSAVSTGASAGATAGGANAGSAPTPGSAGCRSDGRMPGVSRYMPPCVARFAGDNGGATARGVTKDKVIVAVWQPQSDPATSSVVAAAGVGDRPEDIQRTVAALRRYFNQHYETYGREVTFVNVTASGQTSDDQAMRADAVKIAQETKAFAVIAYGEPRAFDEEAIAQGLICIPCGLSPPQAFYRSARGLAFGGYPPNEVYYRHMAEYIGKRLANKPAKWAGNEDFRRQPRKFGLIWVENSPLGGGPPDPQRKAAVDLYRQELARYGVTLTKDVGYLYDTTRLQQQATNAILQMKTAGVSNLAFVGDAITPVFLTQEATRQGYSPEWFITGNLATDNVILGRAYDQTQWAHAFGIGFVFVLPTRFDLSLGFREYRHAGGAGAPASGVATQRQPIETLFTGIHMAGPHLTTESFAQGMYRYPASGGAPSSWLTYYTPEDPTSVKDFKELWWSTTARGQDEYGHDGTGMIMNVDGGRRYKLGTWPTSEPKVFDPASAVTSADDAFFPHENDGHKHSDSQGCRSC